MTLRRTDSPRYNRAWEALKSAHTACFAHPERGPIGMSQGPFSGVNEVLGIIAELEDENAMLRKRLNEQSGETK